MSIWLISVSLAPSTVPGASRPHRTRWLNNSDYRLSKTGEDSVSHRAWKGVTDRGGGPPGGCEEIGVTKAEPGEWTPRRVDTQAKRTVMVFLLNARTQLDWNSISRKCWRGF